MMRKQLLIGSVVAAVCLYFAFRGISTHQIILAFRGADPWWILLALGVYATGFLFRAIRWEILIQPIKTVPWPDLFAPLFIGFLANNILPFRMGEFVRAHITGRKFSISRTASLGTILIERILDTLSFLTTFLVVTLFFPFPAPVKKAACALGIGCGTIIGGLIAIIQHQAHFRRWVDQSPLAPSWKKRLSDSIANLAHGVSSMTYLGHVLAASGLSLVVWTIEGTVLYLMSRSFGVPLGYPRAFFLLFFLGLSVTLPQAPGYVGTVELFGVTALALLGIQKAQALPLILAIHAFQFIFITVFGLWALSKEGISLQKIAQNSKRE
jgi:hypothetical protein